MKWISVEDRLPEDEGICLIAYHPCFYGELDERICVGIGKYIGKNCWARNRHQMVTHWMPLPEPPERDLTDTNRYADNDNLMSAT